MPTHKSNDYKLTAVQYYLVEDKTQEEVCKIFKCTPRSLMRWVERYKNEGNVNIHYRKPLAYKVKKEYVKLLVDEINKNKTILTYKMENNRKGCINRDKNGCKNIQKVFKTYMETGVRPEKYRREYKFQ